MRFVVPNANDRFLENEKPMAKDVTDSLPSSLKSTPVEQPRKSTSLLTTEELTELEERLDKWMNDRSKKIIDDLFDGLKVRFTNRSYYSTRKRKFRCT